MSKVINSSKETELYEKLLGDEDVEQAVVVGQPIVIIRKDNGTGSNSGKGRSRCLTGSCVCKCILITMVLFMVLGIIATAYAYHVMKDFVVHLTVDTPLDPFPTVDMSDEELELVKDRLKLFIDEIRIPGHDHSPREDLIITQDEINGFISHSDYLRGNMYVELQKDTIKEKYSLPVEMLPGGKGRYFVGSDYLKLEPNQDVVEIEMETQAKHEDWFDGPLLFGKLHYLMTKPEDLNMMELYLLEGSTFFGQEASQEFIDSKYNLLESLYEDDNDNDPDDVTVRALIDGIERVRIEPGKIVIQPRRSGGDGDGEYYGDVDANVVVGDDNLNEYN